MGEVARHLANESWSDDDLVAVVQGHEPARADLPDRRGALEALFDRYHARVHDQCRRLLGDDQLADDHTQEIFLSLLERPVRYEGKRHFGSWLYVVVRNHCLNVRRRRNREVPHEDPASIWSEALIDPVDPGRQYQQNETARMIGQTCQKELTSREQEVVHLRYFWGLRVKEINHVLGLRNTSGARTHLTTAHRKLRQALRAVLGDDTLNAILDEE
jgi:RNA polymerase sigma-70 factor (ECF subfamily)